MSFFLLLKHSAQRFYWANRFSQAASLAYATLFSLLPVTALVFGLLTSFAASRNVIPDIQKFLFQQYIPTQEAQDAVLGQVLQFSETLSDLNFLVIAFLVVTALLLINTIEFAMNDVWQVLVPRRLSQRLAVFCTLLVLAPVFAISVYYFAKIQVASWLEGVLAFGYVPSLVSYFVPVCIDFAAFFFFYFMVPKARVRVRSALFGAFVAAVSMSVAKGAFVWYIESFSTYNKLYGAIAVIPVFLLWLYLTWVIVLFAAECSYQFQLPKQGRGLKNIQLFQAGDCGELSLAVQLLAALVACFEKGVSLPSERLLCERLRTSPLILRRVVFALEAAGLIGRENGQEDQLTLKRSPAQIWLSDVEKALKASRREVLGQKGLSTFFSFSAMERQERHFAHLFSDEELGVIAGEFSVPQSSDEWSAAQLPENEEDLRSES